VRKFAVVQVDVFTSQPLEGNAVAVFTDARGLSDTEMQALAKETNLSETTYILPRDAATERERGVRVRIFTVREELDFAGHPTLGTAFVLRQASGAKRVELDLKVGKIPVEFEQAAGQPMFGEMRQADPQFGLRHDAPAVAQALGLSLDDLDQTLPVQTVSTGMGFTIVPLRSLELMRRLQISQAAANAYLQRTDGKFFYFVTRECVAPSARLHARMFFYNGEDPATGSAAGCTAAWMAAHGVAQSDEQVLIEQGLEMKRPSHIFVRATRTHNGAVNVRVGGNAVEVARGEFSL
jgi:trans-2,3-dihydro-3-hydroxyanthranilate isomerase